MVGQGVVTTRRVRVYRVDSGDGGGRERLKSDNCFGGRGFARMIRQDCGREEKGT